jgi:Arc/MetJ family transcription regulator
MIMVVAPSGRSLFQVTLPSPSPSSTVESSYFVPGGEAYGGRCYALPPQATLTCSVSVHAEAGKSTSVVPASSSGARKLAAAGSNFQDALFVFDSTCTSSPLLTVPLLATAGSAMPPASSFTPASILSPPNPPSSFWQHWKLQRDQGEENERRREEVQRETYQEGMGKADVFILERSDDEADGDEAMVESDEHRRAEELKAAAARADEEDEEMSDAHPAAALRGSSTTASASSSSSRSGLTTAGVYRSGLSARIHSSHGMRSSGGMGTASGNKQMEPGVMQVFQPFARPATAEQRHLAEQVDVSFVQRTEIEIDALMEEELEEVEEQEEQLLLQSEARAVHAASRPATAALRDAVVPPLSFAPAQLVGEGGDDDEQDFYQQILATARGMAKQGATATASPPVVPRKQSAGARVSSGRRSQGGSSVNRSSPSPPMTSGSPSASPLQEEQSYPRYSPESSVRRQPQPDARPASRSKSGVGVVGLMRGLSLDRQPSATGEWTERLAREQDVERRRYTEEQCGQPSSQAYAHRPPSGSVTSVKLPKLR